MIQPKDTETILKEFFDPNETFSYNLDRQAVRQALASHLLWVAQKARPGDSKKFLNKTFKEGVERGTWDYYDALRSLAQKITE